MKDLEGKKIIVFGIANKNSLAWSIAQELHERGAQLAFNYLNERMEKKVRPLAESLNASIIEECDVSNDEQIESFFSKVSNEWGKVDALVHSVAFANREDLEGRFVDTSRSGFLTAMDISAYSLVKLSQKVEPLMSEGGSIVTLSYLGAVQVVPNYNVMGVAKAALEACVRYLAADMGENKIRVNAISAGPVKTLSAAGIKDFRSMLSKAEEKTPLKENITGQSVGQFAAFLCSDLSKYMTGSTMYVDSGSHIMA